MKKFVSILLVLVLMMSLSVAAFAEGTTDQGTTPTDQENVIIKKEYKLAGAGTSPEETFTLKQVGKTVTQSEATEAPDLGTITGALFGAGAATVNGATGDITVALPAYDHVGVYTYILKEIDDNKTAGVTYYGNEIKLVVTVINNGNGKLRIATVHTESAGETKSDKFTNTYSAGTLNVSKTVEGNLGDKGKYFEFKVTLTGETDKNYGESYAVSGGSNASNPTSIKIGEETTFLLKNGDTISIENLPYHVSYTVTETAADGYTTTVNGTAGNTITSEISAAAQTASFTNTRVGEIDMGVSMDSLPYILMLVVVGAAVVVIATRKKGEQF